MDKNKKIDLDYNNKTILEIKEVEDVAFKGRYAKFDGYRLALSGFISIYLLIENGQACSEEYGYISTNDNLQEFVGATILKIELSNEIELIDLTEIKKLSGLVKDEFYAEFITIYTSKGSFQLAVYNAHNGFYGHQVLCILKNENHIDYIIDKVI